MCSTLSQFPAPGFWELDMSQYRLQFNKKLLKSLYLKVDMADTQGQFYSAIDLGELAAELDTMERRRMAEVTDLPIILARFPE